ncbi:MAG TPA: hypothetical protein VMB72_13730, partial [Acidimicrobiales bacterium]|nr:hypothetical protein [Acidimicrobiales bacterium]
MAAVAGLVLVAELAAIGTAGAATASISAVGSVAQHSGTGVTTLGLSPQHVGDLLALAVKADSSSATVSAVAGGGVSSWSRAQASTGYSGHDLEIWTGVVTAAGSSTVTVSFAAGVSSTETALLAEEFSTTGTSWAVDTGAGISNASSTTATYPKLTPSGSGELYFGYDAIAQTGAAGSTSGFSYAVTTDADVATWDTAVSAAVQPTAKQSPAGTSGGVAILVASSGATTPPTGISAVGSFVSKDGTDTTTVAVTPEHVGDLLVLMVKVGSSTVTVSSVSGGG